MIDQQGMTESVSAHAEGVSAFQALEVVEDVLIQKIPERGSRSAASNCANHAADDRSSNAASDYSAWACEGTCNGADTSA